MLEIIRNDKLIQLYAQHQVERIGYQEDLRRADKNNIRNKIRSIARLVIECAKDNKLSLSDILTPAMYNRAVEAVRTLAKESDQLGLALTIYVKQLTLLKIAEAISSSNTLQKVEAEEFLQLYNASWTNRVSAHIGRRQRMEKLSKTKELPLEEDLITFSRFLSAEMKTCKDDQRLKKVVLSNIMLFNKRRPMEVHELKVEDYTSAKKSITDPHDVEMLNKMSATEKMIAKR